MSSIGIILVGNTLSGKSSIVRDVRKDFRDIKVISTGKIAREMEEYKERLIAGELADEDLMRKEIDDRLTGADVYLIDSVRGVDQLAWIMPKFDKVCIFHIHCPYEDILNRAENRGRDDDNVRSIEIKNTRFNNELGEEYVFAINNNIPWYIVENSDATSPTKRRRMISMLIEGFLKR